MVRYECNSSFDISILSIFFKFVIFIKYNTISINSITFFKKWFVYVLFYNYAKKESLDHIPALFIDIIIFKIFIYLLR